MEEFEQVDQNLEEPVNASAHDSLERGPEPAEVPGTPVPTIPTSDYSPAGDWPDGPKRTEPEIVIDQLRRVQRRVVQIMAQDEHGNDVPINFLLENEPDDEDRFFVRKVD